MIESASIRKYYNDNRLAQKGIGFKEFTAAANQAANADLDSDHYYVMKQVEHSLLNKSLEFTPLADVKASEGLYRVRGLVRTVSKIHQSLRWDSNYRFMTLMDSTGTLEVVLSRRYVDLESLSISVGTTVEAKGQVRKNKRGVLQLVNLCDLSLTESLEGVETRATLDALKPGALVDVTLRVVKVLHQPAPRPLIAIVEDAQGMTTLRYWPDSNLELSEGTCYDVTNLAVSNERVLRLTATGRSQQKATDKGLYTYLSDVYNTAIEGLKAGLLYNFQVVLTMVGTLTYPKDGIEKSVTKYILRTVDDQQQLTLVDWSNAITESNKFKQTNQKYRITYVYLTFYKETGNLSASQFTEVLPL